MTITSNRVGRAVVAALVGLSGLWVAGCGGSDAESNAPPEVKEIRQLAKSDKDEHVKIVVDRVQHKDQMVAAEAVRGLGQMRRPQAADALRKVAASDQRGGIRQEAVIQLGRKNEPQSLEVLRQIVKTDPDPRVRGAAATSIARLGSLTDVAVLMDVAETDNDLVVQSRAVGAVEQLIGLKFGFDSKAAPEARKKAMERMRSVALTAASVLQQERNKRKGS